MDKIIVRLAFVFMLCALPGTAAWAQDANGGGDGEPAPAASAPAVPSTPLPPATPPVTQPPAPSAEKSTTNGKPSGKPKPSPRPVAPPPVEKFTVTFNTDGGAAIDDMQIEKDKPIENLQEATGKEGFTFAGWLTEKNGGGTVFTNKTPVTNNITLFAKWDKIQKDNGSADISDSPNAIKLPETQTPTQFPQELLLLAAGAFALVLIALGLLSFIFLLGMRKKLPVIIKKFDALAKKQDETKTDIIKEIRESHSSVPPTPPQQDGQIEGLRNEIVQLRNENSTYRNRIKSLEAEAAGRQNEEKSVSSDPVSMFNNWAVYPSALPPTGFAFLSGTIKIRESQNLSESSVETEWITNRGGAKKYLFPNPRLLNDRSNITAYYTNGSGFKPRGQNKIRIIEPCEIGDSGYIQYPGKLDIL